MDNVTAQFRQANQTQHLWTAKDIVVVAVSTGVDSMVLLSLFQSLPESERPHLVVAHVNHKLRAASDDEEAFLKTYLAERNIPLFVGTWSPEQHPKQGIEAAARAFRYEFFAEVMAQTQATLLATAHQKNEQVETGLMRMAAGHSFTSSLQIPWRRQFGHGQLIRPLLNISKLDLRQFAKRNHIPSFEDATNQELTATRNRFRQQIIPLLIEENPQFIADFANSLTMQAAVNDYVLTQATAMLVEVAGSVTKVLSQSLPAALLLKQAFAQVQPSVSVTMAAWQNAAHGLQVGPAQADYPLTANWILRRRYDQFDFLETEKKRTGTRRQEQTMVPLNKWTQLTGDTVVGAFDAQATVVIQPAWHSAHLTVEKAQLPLMIRTAQPDDRLALKGGGHQTVQRIWINQRVTREQRDQQLLVVGADGTPLWLVGQRVAATSPIDSTHQLVEICINFGQGAKHG
ncbi:tRNA lysidine(34) synthetase TilS [Furfurilactobacillus siliginis]|nr:tRNA lysidine(34) synthetase TilS [Furfurilactobacillus siliginis]GEK28934.1 tRNA(Ile)-lysidine synthase [Furfurilactobacillus siliginis]